MSTGGNTGGPIGNPIATGDAEPELRELDFQRPWRERTPRSRLTAAVAGSLLYHVILLLLLVFMPGPSLFDNAPRVVADLNRATPLYFPKELTQRDPNKGKIPNELDVRSAPPPAPVPQAPRFRPPVLMPRPAPSVPTIAIEAPALESAAPPPPPSPGRLPETVAPPPERPKLVLENVGANGTAERINAAPGAKVPPATVIAEAASGGPRITPGGGMVIGDIDDSSPFGSSSAPSNGPVRSNLQLLSDPSGVDFKPYLVQILTAVRTNWLSVIPESARLGRKGRVLVQFIIDKRGRMPKIVIAEESGTLAFDRAAVAGVSASVPFPPLPREYKGNEVRLQLAFTYNMPSR